MIFLLVLLKSAPNPAYASFPSLHGKKQFKFCHIPDFILFIFENSQIAHVVVENILIVLCRHFSVLGLGIHPPRAVVVRVATAVESHLEVVVNTNIGRANPRKSRAGDCDDILPHPNKIHQIRVNLARVVDLVVVVRKKERRNGRRKRRRHRRHLLLRRRLRRKRAVEPQVQYRKRNTTTEK